MQIGGAVEDEKINCRKASKLSQLVFFSNVLTKMRNTIHMALNGVKVAIFFRKITKITQCPGILPLRPSYMKRRQILALVSNSPLLAKCWLRASQ